MGKIVAMGGGLLRELETFDLDKRVVELSGKTNPNLLFIPTASGDPDGYYEIVQNIYGDKLGCKTEVLYLIRQRPSDQEIAHKIAAADAVYVGGGNTMRMMKLWRKRGVDAHLKAAYERGVVMSGISAGAICWFAYGHSDSKSFTAEDENNWSYIRVKGMGLYDLIYCPHVLSEGRFDHFVKFMGKYSQIGIACDDFAALEIVDDEYRIITSRKEAKAFRVFRQNREVVKQEIEQQAAYKPLSELLSR